MHVKHKRWLLSSSVSIHENDEQKCRYCKTCTYQTSNVLILFVIASHRDSSRNAGDVAEVT